MYVINNSFICCSRLNKYMFCIIHSPLPSIIQDNREYTVVTHTCCKPIIYFAVNWICEDGMIPVTNCL